jgi:hypothetical protein
VQSRNVKILATEGETCPRSPASEPNEQLVTDGFDKLQNGTKIVDQAAGAAAPGAPSARPLPRRPM